MKIASNSKCKCFYKQLWKISLIMFANKEIQLLNVLKNSLRCINVYDLEFILQISSFQTYIRFFCIFTYKMHLISTF